MTYASATAAGRSNYRRNQNSVSFTKQKAKLGPVSNAVILIVLGCILSLLYLGQVTRTSSYSYTLDELTKDKTSLQDDISALELESARLQSIGSARTGVVAANLVDPVEITYAN